MCGFTISAVVGRAPRFQTAIVGRHFMPDFRVGSDYSDDALCGVDNALAPAALEDVGFGRIIETDRGGFRSNNIEAVRWRGHMRSAARPSASRTGGGGC